MGEPLLSTAGVSLALALVVLNAFFVAAEFALVRVRETRLQELEAEGRLRASGVRGMLQDLDGYLSVCQVGITMASLGLGWVGVPVVAGLVRPVLAAVGVTNEGVIGVVAFVLGFSVITYVHLVFGEQAPKYFSSHKAEGTAVRLSRPLGFFMVVLRPVVWLANASTDLVLRPWGIKPGEEMEAHSEEELRLMITSSAASGELNPEERDYLNNVFDFGDRVAREIMVPRPDVEALPHDAPLPDLAEKAAFGRFTRYPVYDGDLDNVLGSIHVKDVFRAADEVPERFDLRSLVRECLVVPENKPIEQILREFQGRKLQMAIVVNEWGSVEGLITIEDVLEELVGEIQDEFDRDEAAIEHLGDGLYAVDGRISITDVNDRFGLGLSQEDFDTIGGYVFGSLGRPPEPGDTVEAAGVTLQVKAVEGPRVSMLTLHETEAVDGAEESDRS